MTIDTQDGREPPAAPEVDADVEALQEIADGIEQRPHRIVHIARTAAAALLAQQRTIDEQARYHAKCTVAMVRFVPAFGWLHEAIAELGQRAETAEKALAAARSDLRVMTDSYDAATRRQAVPREPTEAMIRAGSAKYTRLRPWDDIAPIWRAMWDAASAEDAK